jgi:tripartite-type tricarboxylate transporter receptor subunit TctC
MSIDSLNRRAFLTATAVGLSGAAASAAAAGYPERRIRLVVPFPAGGVVDIAARAVSDFLAADLGQPVVVEALPGAGGAIGTQTVAHSPADGYTCVLATISHVAAPQLQPANYDPIKDFAAAGLLAWGKTVAVVPASSPVKSLKDLVELAKARNGQLNYLNPGNGSVAHLATEALKHQAGIDMQSVAYKGLPPGMQDLITGRLDFAVVALPIPTAMIQAGKLRAIGVMLAEREPELPGVMTYEEQGFGGAVVRTWDILALPAATPKPIVDRINNAVNRAVADNGVKQRLMAASIRPASPMQPDQVQRTMQEDYQKIARLIKAANIKPGG